MSYFPSRVSARFDLSPPRFTHRYGGRQLFRVRDVVGVLSEVDAGMADVLRICNAHGYPTEFSCSGLLIDHPSTQEGAEHGYISFHKMDTKRERRIDRTARAAGMGSEPRHRRHGPRIDTSVLRDGTAMNVQLALLNDARKHDKLWSRRWLQQREREIIAQHGGWIDDGTVARMWALFTRSLTGEEARVFV